MIEDEREALGAHAKSEQHTNSPTAQPMARGAHMRAADASGEAGLSARIVPPTARFVPAHAAGAQMREASSDEGMAPAGTPDGGPVVSSAASSAAESDVVPADEPSDVLNDGFVKFVTTQTDRIGNDHTSQRNNGNFCSTATDITYHVTFRLVNGNLSPNGCC